MYFKNLTISFFVFANIMFISCNNSNKSSIIIENNNLKIEFNNLLHSKISVPYDIENEISNNYTASEFIEVKQSLIQDFKITDNSEKDFSDKIGKGKITTLKGIFEKNNIKIEKIIELKTYKNFDNEIFIKVYYVNKNTDTISVNKWVNNSYQINRRKSDTIFWSFQGSSSFKRADWILPLNAKFYQKNYMGMNNSDYGGGIPVLDIWRSDVGIAIGHTELVPKLNSLPVKTNKTGKIAEISLEFDYNQNSPKLGYNDTLSTFETFVMSHKGDCYSPLKQFSQYMRAKGIIFINPEPSAYEPIWCAWGYEREFTLKEIITTLPKVKELGIKWAVLDDGYQIAEGDWNVNKDKFPKGDSQMKDLVNKIHSYGLKAKIWWAPLAADPCTDFVKDHKDAIITNEEEVPRFITWWDSYYMSSADSATIKHTHSVLDMFIDQWGFDGLKMDGQHMNAAPKNQNWAQKGTIPIDAVEKVPAFFKNIYEYSTKKDSDIVIENCPCGCCMSFYNMPYMNQAVSSDPTSSWQIRLKGKVYKAIIGKTAYYGDHVELSDNGNDFASSFGIGAVLGTKFTYPKDNPNAETSYLLTPEKEIIWKKWFKLYNEKMLSKEDYLGNLYDIGFDKPEAHVIKKGDTLYYAFYADKWDGDIELKGLKKGNYLVNDYFIGKNIGTISSDNPKINTSFNKFLLIEVYENTHGKNFKTKRHD